MSEPLRSPKLKPWHRERVAVVYVRQSTPQQVTEHQESTARQYALADRAAELGWPHDRVVIIDEDLGKSGQSTEGRLGFQRLLAEVALDHVGLILGLEMSRLARSCRDWHQLLELCARFRTLLADADGLYDPTDYNDRRLLGLKGTMSEAELHVLKERMYQGKLNKARRGELYGPTPIGYIRIAGGPPILDPDEQVQTVVRLIFDQFDRQGTVHGLLRYLVHHGIQIPVRPHGGPNRGQLEWHRPNRETLQDMLHHPIYAGAYRHGHRATQPASPAAGPARHGASVSAAGGVPGPDSRPPAGLHHLGTLRCQPGTARRQPGTLRRGGGTAQTALPCWVGCCAAAVADGGCWCAIAGRRAATGMAAHVGWRITPNPSVKACPGQPSIA